MKQEKCVYNCVCHLMQHTESIKIQVRCVVGYTSDLPSLSQAKRACRADLPCDVSVMTTGHKLQISVFLGQYRYLTMKKVKVEAKARVIGWCTGLAKPEDNSHEIK